MMKKIHLFIHKEISILFLITISILVLSCEKVNISALSIDETYSTNSSNPTTGTIQAEAVDGDFPGWGLYGTISLYNGNDNVYYSKSLESIQVEDYGDYAYFRNLEPGSYRLKFTFTRSGYSYGSRSFAVERGKTTYARFSSYWGGDGSWFIGEPQ